MCLTNDLLTRKKFAQSAELLHLVSNLHEPCAESLVYGGERYYTWKVALSPLNATT